VGSRTSLIQGSTRQPSWQLPSPKVEGAVKMWLALPTLPEVAAATSMKTLVKGLPHREGETNCFKISILLLMLAGSGKNKLENRRAMAKERKQLLLRPYRGLLPCVPHHPVNALKV